MKPEEAVIIMSQEFHGLPQSSIHAMVQRYDRDNNGMVDFGEIIEFYACLKAKLVFLCNVVVLGIMCGDSTQPLLIWG